MNEFGIGQYDYALPEESIAIYPLEERDSAKMLVYEQGRISHSIFKELPTYLPAESLLVFNNTRVVRARLFFRRSTGALIEVFCLKPLGPHKEISLAMKQKESAVWECMAGNQKRWKEGETLSLDFGAGVLNATLKKKIGREVEVEFRWSPPEMTFSEVLEHAGKIPLPPYIHREATEKDEEEYQTVYAKEGGAVAAPTAGLHFTDELIGRVKEAGAETLDITLHVSAGTFQPVEEADVRNHKMHDEQIIFTRASIQSLAESNRKIIAVGTTAMRALESLYWFGVKIENEGADEFFIEKLYPYSKNLQPLPRQESLSAILKWMEEKGIEELWGHTEIMIMPGYSFRMCEGLITNFHLPKSTLLMLIAAFIGDDWKRIYEEALSNNYRFLSYGDGSLLLRG
jgi:S-adenosylmethionine:tRNA ribosyltransferase-isomerase